MKYIKTSYNKSLNKRRTSGRGFAASPLGAARWQSCVRAFFPPPPPQFPQLGMDLPITSSAVLQLFPRPKYHPAAVVATETSWYCQEMKAPRILMPGTEFHHQNEMSEELRATNI